MLILFSIAVFFCIYTYFLFPVFLHLKAARSRESDTEKNTLTKIRESELPSVSVLLAVHNEASNLPNKLASLRALDYPQDLIQICVVSDGSTDDTVRYLESQSDITWDHYAPAAGKPTALNRAVDMATGEVLLFTDARQAVSENSARALVSRLQDENVGAVSGELVLSDDGVTEAANVGLYWRYEKWIRYNESLLFSTTGATGALYVIRRKDAIELPSDTLLDDFETPINLLRQKRRTVFEPEAKAFDRAESDSSREFTRKVRTLAGNIQSFSRNTWLFSPTSNAVWWQFLSHKVARLLVPYALLLAFVAAWVGQGWFLATAFWLQVIFYGLGILTFLAPRLSEMKMLNIIKLFLQLNAAAVVGTFRYIAGRSSVTWKGRSA